MSDLISRQAVITLMNSLPKWFDGESNLCLDYADVINALSDKEKLPSAEKTQLSQEDATFDCISRQAAIEWCLEGLNNMPSAEPERKKGRWINAYPDIEPNPMFMHGVCSECGFEQSISDKLNYCPNCGANMGVEHE